MASSVLRGFDSVLDALIVPSFTRIGPAIRKRLFDWTDVEVAGRRIAITGPTSGLGKAAARELAAAGAELVLLARNPAKLDTLVDELTALGPGPFSTITVDLGDLDAVRSAGAELGALSSLDVLVHNAGALHNTRTETDDGLELTFASHVVAPFLITTGAVPALRNGDDPRIITMSSGGMYSQKIVLDDLQTRRGYKGTVAYARAKRAQIDLTGVWAERLAADGISAHAMHPGWAATPGVSDALPGFDKVIGPLLRTPEEGADTLVWLCGAPAAEIGTDGFWLDRRRRPTAYLPGTETDPTDVDRLWRAVCEVAGVDPAFPG